MKRLLIVALTIAHFGISQLLCGKYGRDVYNYKNMYWKHASQVTSTCVLKLIHFTDYTEGT